MASTPSDNLVNPDKSNRDKLGGDPSPGQPLDATRPQTRPPSIAAPPLQLQAIPQPPAKVVRPAPRLPTGQQAVPVQARNPTAQSPLPGVTKTADGVEGLGPTLEMPVVYQGSNTPHPKDNHAAPPLNRPSHQEGPGPHTLPARRAGPHAPSPGPAKAVIMRPEVLPDQRVSRLEWTRGLALSGRYVMVEQLGEGGMGTVYLADDLLLQRRVALKTLWTDQAYDPSDIERFRKEVAMAHAVNHPNIARTYDLGEAGGVQFITMEHLRGETLMARIKRGPTLTSQEVREMAGPLCRGLRAAHRAGVVHRDLKPANIMLVPDDRKCVIMDFGIARSAGEGAVNGEVLDLETTRARRAAKQSAWGVTSAGLGTPAYMAPEQWDERSGDQRTDIYALGVILYVCLTGVAPYSAESAEELADKHRSAPVPDVAALAKGVDRDLAALVRSCLAKRPEDRPQTMSEVLERLERPALRKAYVGRLVTWALTLAVAFALLGIATIYLGDRVRKGIESKSETALIREMRPAQIRLAQLLARDIDVKDLDQIRKPEDVHSAAFERVHAAMERWHTPEITQMYTMRAGTKPNAYLEVADWRPVDRDENHDGHISEDEKGALPGDDYDGTSSPAMADTFRTGKACSDDDFKLDAFGISLSAYAPILRDGKPSEYFVGVDAPNAQLNQLKSKMAIDLSELRVRLMIILSGVWLIIVAALAYTLDPARRRAKAERARERLLAGGI